MDLQIKHLAGVCRICNPIDNLPTAEAFRSKKYRVHGTGSRTVNINVAKKKKLKLGNSIKAAQFFFFL